MVRSILIAASVIALIAAITINGEAAGDTEELTVYCGVTAYPNPNNTSQTEVEFQFSIERSQFEFFQPDSSESTWYARIFAQIDLFDKEGMAVDSLSTYFSIAAVSEENAARADVRIFNKLAGLFDPGQYTARLTIIDVVNKNRGIAFLEEVNVPAPVLSGLSLSGLTLAYSIEDLGDSVLQSYGRLERNGFRIIPNPVAIFSLGTESIGLYAEAYNLAFDSGAEVSTFRVDYTLLDEKGDEFEKIATVDHKKVGGTSVLARRIRSSDWPIGVFTLRMVVTDTEVADSDTTEIKLAIISPEVLAVATRKTEANNPYDTLALAAKRNLVKYLLDPADQSTLKQLTERGQGNFLAQFWREWEASHGPAGPSRAEIVRRYSYVNQFFSTFRELQDGWSTDRGRIYMRHGPWDDIEDHPTPSLEQPFQIWHYFGLEEGVIFVFKERLGGDQDYRLVHSTAEGEIWDPAWDARIKGEPETDRD